MYKKSAILGVVVMAASGFGWAGTWVLGAKVESVTVQPHNNIYVSINQAAPALNCPGGNSTSFLQLDPTLPHFDEQFSLFHTALLEDQTLDVYVEGCGYYAFAKNTRVYKNP